MKVGFTGTREGISVNQHRELIKFIKENDFTELHHGDCVGADAQMHEYTRLFKPNCIIVVRPPKNEIRRAWCQGDIIKEPMDYIPRDRLIVDSVDLLVACPLRDEEELRSGSWTTIRYARKQNVEYIRFDR